MKACIFDLDGTLTNTLESMTYSVNLTLKERWAFPDHKRSVQIVCREWSKSSDRKVAEGAGDPRLQELKKE